MILPKTVVYLAIGDAMEEKLNLMEENLNSMEIDLNFITSDINYQWRQLFPVYIENASKKFTTEIIIITPNINCEPTFLVKTQKKYKWVKVDGIYKSSNPKYKITVRIFITPFPCIDTNNNKIVEYLETKKTITTSTINDVIQTTTDIAFLEDFNNTFTKYVNYTKQNGIIICNYLAVFNDDSIYSAYNNFYFAPILKNIIKNKNNDTITSLLLKWTFKPTITSTYLVLPLLLPCNFSYVNEYANNTYNITICDETVGLKIIINDTKKIKFETLQELIKYISKYITLPCK